MTNRFGFTKQHANIIKIAIMLATNGHNDTNHKYGNGSYTIHLAHVVDIAYRFIHLVPIELRAIVIAACYLHDSIEDARLSYNDIVKAFTNGSVDKKTAVMIAEIIRAVTNYTRGRNRKERMPDFIYQEIRETIGATFTKLCDRIANIEFGGKAEMYEKEHGHFKDQLFNLGYEEMFEYIQEMFGDQLTKPQLS
jgi:(p)ppGpp synthase/HD superfamily hydrolase